MTTRRRAWVAALANLVLAPRDRWRAPTAPRPAPAPPPTRAQAVACLFFSIRATGPLSFFAILAVAGGRVVALVADAAVVARRANPYAPKADNRWWVYLAVPVVLVLVMEPVGPWVRRNVVAGFSLPSSSMMPTLLPGDFLLADKRAHATAAPRRPERVRYYAHGQAGSRYREAHEGRAPRTTRRGLGQPEP